MFQSASTTSWTWMYIAACRKKLWGTWPTAEHQFRKSPAVDNYAQPTILLCHHVTGWRSSAAPFRSLVLLRGTLYRIVSVIQHWVLTVFEGNNLKRGIICELLNSLSAVEMLHDSALYKFTNDIDTDMTGHVGDGFCRPRSSPTHSVKALTITETMKRQKQILTQSLIKIMQLKKFNRNYSGD